VGWFDGGLDSVLRMVRVKVVGDSSDCLGQTLRVVFERSDERIPFVNLTRSADEQNSFVVMLGRRTSH